MHSSPHLPNPGMSQEEIIIAHLNSFDSSGSQRRTISAMEALGLYRICSLSSRISVIQKRFGYKITKFRKVDTTGKRYVRYGLTDLKKRF